MSQRNLPSQWKVLPLGEVARLERGKFTHRPRNDPEFYGGNIPFIQTGDVANSDGYIRTYSQTLNEKGLSVSRIFPTGTIVITIAANIGHTGILEFDSAFPDSLIGITPFDNIDKDYLNYYLRTPQAELDRQAPRGTQKNINIQFLNPWAVVVPPLLEQRAIAHTLLTIQKAKEARQRELELERERKAALMQYLFTHGTGNEPCKETEVGEIAQSWKVVKFGEVCESSAFGPRFSGSLYSTSGNVATLRTTDMDKEGNINYSTMPFATLELEKYKNHLLKPKDFLITRSGSCGIAAVFESFDKPVIPGAFLIRFRLSKELDPYFLRYYINSSIGSSRISQLARGAIQQNISGTSLRNFAVPLPSLPEQLDIVNILGSCDRKITALEQEAAFLDELFRAMLEELMTGRLSALPLVEENA
jgi:type I restriction enzyme S subunit